MNMTDDSRTRIRQGEVVKCDECQYARPIVQPPVEMFGNIVGYGPGGETDQFIERDGEVTCYRCNGGFDDEAE